MSIQTILAATSGGAGSDGAVQLACRLTRRFSAHLEGYHVLLEPATAIGMAGNGMAVPPPLALIESMMEDAKAKAAATRAIFEGILKQYEIPRGGPPQVTPEGPSFGWREEAGEAPILVARRGRFFDLVVLGRSGRVVHEPYSDTIEEVLLRSGRPVLLAPAEAPTRIGDVVALAWDGSPQAVRALAAGLPFLKKANAVFLITAGDSDRLGAAEVLRYLAWHRVNAEHQNLSDASTRHVGEKLFDAAQEGCADMLIMGGYGHTPWGELLFGGVTRDAIATMPMPLLLVH
jgi:nucleotide-binding universal stress UspA family protein